MTDISNKVLERIHKEGTASKPRWRFTLMNALMWGGFGVFVLLAGVSLGTSFFLIADNDVGAFIHLPQGAIRYLLMSIPYAWIVLLSLILFATVSNFRRTKKGYRHATTVVVGISFVLALLVGVGVHSTGLGARTDALLATRVPNYNTAVVHRVKLWSNPDDGRLAGNITKIRREGRYDLRDLEGRTWTLKILPSSPAADQKLAEGDKIGLIGRRTGASEFTVNRIRMSQSARK